MYNHKKQLLLSVLLGIIIGAGGMRFAFENGIIDLNSSSIPKRNTLKIPPSTTIRKPYSDTTPQQITPTAPTFTSTGLEWLTPIKKNNYCELQELLRDFDVYNGTIDGLLGKKSVKAIRAIQKYFGLKETGKASVGLLSKLNADVPNDADIHLSNISNPANTTILLRSNKSRIAPLEVITSVGHGDYAVKLVKTTNKQDEIMFFVRGGIPAKVNVPLGSYYIKYAYGDTWYSNRCLFGKYTSYNKADEIFNFTSNGRSVSGYTVELILQSDGNLRTRKIPKKDW